MHRRYLDAAPPREGEHQSLAYRLRLLFLDRWNLWHRLTRYRTWKGPQGETLDGTNNACERAIGWWIKERYRSMRGYKVPENAVRVSRFLAWCGNFLNQGKEVTPGVPASSVTTTFAIGNGVAVPVVPFVTTYVHVTDAPVRT